MDRPPFEKLQANYYRGVQCVMEIVSGLLKADPRDSTEVFFGIMGDAIRPNYQVTCHGRRFVFLGANHLPFQGRLHTDPPHQLRQPDKLRQLREGYFEPDHLIPQAPPGWPYTDIRGYATEETEDDDGRFEEMLRRKYEGITLPPLPDFAEIERDIKEIEGDPNIPETDRLALVNARVGQGQFRDGLLDRWKKACAVTGCTVLQILRASHMKPWRESTNPERLDPANGLLLTAHFDALFDKELISFTDDGEMLVSSFITAADQQLLGVPQRLRLPLNDKERAFLTVHRERFKLMETRARVTGGLNN